MNDPLPLHIATFFLFILTIEWSKLTWSELGFAKNYVALNPLRFLFGAVAGLLSIVVLTVFIGVQFIGLSVLIALSGLLSLAHPTIAICVLTSYLIMRPWELLPQVQALGVLPRLFAMIALLSWVLFLVRRQSLKIVWNHSSSILVAFIIWLLLTCIPSGSPDQALKVVFGFLPIFVIFFLILNVPDRLRAIDGLVKSIILSVVSVMAVALYVTGSFYGLTSGERLVGLGLTGNSNDLAACIVFVLPLLLFPILRKGYRGFFRPVNFLALAVLFFALWLSQSRGALVAIGVMALVYLLFDKRSFKSAIFAVIIGVALLAASMLGIEREEADLVTSSESRWGYLIAGLRMFSSSPIFGVGAYNYPRFYDRFAVVFYEEGQSTAHSSWILPLAEAGLLGFILFTSFYLIAVMRSWKIKDSRPEYFYALVGYGVVISFLSHTYMIFPYLIAGLAICAVRIIEADSGTSESLEVVGDG